MILTLLLLVLLYALLAGHWLLVIAVVTWVSYWYESWWLFVIAVLIDGYFGAFGSIPILSLTFGAFVLLVESLKIHLIGKAQ